MRDKFVPNLTEETDLFKEPLKNKSIADALIHSVHSNSIIARFKRSLRAPLKIAGKSNF